MLHAKILRRFLKGFYHIWVCGHRGHVTWIIIHIHFCNLALIGQVVSEEKIFDIVDGWMDDGRMADGYTISSPCSNCQKKKKKKESKINLRKIS